MSNNCYRPAKDDAEHQNDRLTNKHIQTLAFLQELSRENKELKTRVEELEKECSECAELHAIAKDAKAKIQKIQEDCNRRVDQHNKGLTAKHEQEVMQLISEKLEAENDWIQERDKLLKLIAEKEETNIQLIEQLEQLKKHDVKVDVVNQRLDKTIAEFMTLKKKNELLQAENSQLNSQVTGYRADAEKLQEYEQKNKILESKLKEKEQKLKELSLKVSLLITELDGEEERNSNRNSAQDKLRLRVSNLTQELKIKNKEVVEFDDILRELRVQIQERSEKLEFELIQKEKLIMYIQRLEDELKIRDFELQKRQSPSVKREESPSFTSFVQMKREINILKDENETLKQVNKKPLALPSLKAPSGDGGSSHSNHQSLSTQSTWSSKWSKR